MVQLILAKGARLCTKCGSGGDALKLAAWQGHAKIVELLIQKGMDVNGCRPRKGTPLGYAARDNKMQVINEYRNLYLTYAFSIS